MFYHPSLQQIANRIKRLQGEYKIHEYLLVTRKVFFNLIFQLDQLTKVGVILYATFYLAFMAFL